MNLARFLLALMASLLVLPVFLGVALLAAAGVVAVAAAWFFCAVWVSLWRTP